MPGGVIACSLSSDHGVRSSYDRVSEVPDQCAITGTRLGKGADPAKVRDQRQHSCPWRRIEIGRAALEVASLAHQPVTRARAEPLSVTLATLCEECETRKNLVISIL